MAKSKKIPGWDYPTTGTHFKDRSGRKAPAKGGVMTASDKRAIKFNELKRQTTMKVRKNSKIRKTLKGIYE